MIGLDSLKKINGFDQGAPMDYFEKEDSEKAINDAEKIIEYAKSNIFK